MATAAPAPCTGSGHRLQPIQGARRGCTIDSILVVGAWLLGKSIYLIVA